jgi:hypothetical protein
VLIAVVLCCLGLVEPGLGFVAPAGKVLERLAVVLDHAHRPPFGGVEIADHLIAHHGVESDACQHPKALRLLAPQPGRLFDRGAQRSVELALVRADLADRLLHRGQRVAAREHGVPSLPGGNAAFEHRHPELGLEEAAALLGHARVLHDAVPGLVAADGRCLSPRARPRA